MQSPGSCLIVSCERTRNSLLAQFEQFFTLNFRVFQPAFHDCSTLLALLLGEVQFAHHATHTPVPFTALARPAPFAISHAFTMSFHPLGAVSLERSILSRWCLRL